VRAADWLDHRTGYRSFLHHALHEPVRGGASWAYVFGSALAILFAMQICTGVLLAMFYSPSTKEAWGSVHYLQHEVAFGWFVRGLHHYASGAMILLLVLHLFQVFVFRAYAPPRELNWWTGLALLGITLGFSVTGYLLPWDQKGFWATRVVTSIAGAMPWFGHFAKTTLQGGNDLGNLTLTRFFGFHVFLLPAALGIVLAVHIVLFRRHGVTPRASRKDAELDAKTEPFWPRQVTYDMIFFTFVLATLAAITIRNHGASLEAPADPSSGYPARPEWYFLWLFELLKVVPGWMEGPALFALVVSMFAFLALLPVVDRGPRNTIRARWPHFVVASALAAIVLTLNTLPMIEDAGDKGFQALDAAAEADAARASKLAEAGIPPGGASDLYLNDPLERGKRLFAAQCQSCHKADGKGGDSAPDLTGFISAPWIRGVIADPTKPAYFGRTKVTGMDPSDATPAELDTLTQYTMSLGGAAHAPPGGADLFEEKGCQACHARAGEDPLTGPSLAGYGSRDWILGAIKDAGKPAYYGDQNKMPVFVGKLTNAQMDDIVTYVLSTPAKKGT
jgi:ubiquinol-cytochrome c reductase cytochrome b subunit